SLSLVSVSCMSRLLFFDLFVFFQAEDGIRDSSVTGVQTCALPIWLALGAVGQFARKTSTIERAFAAGEVAGLAGSFARAGGFDRLVDNFSSGSRVLL